MWAAEAVHFETLQAARVAGAVDWDSNFAGVTDTAVTVVVGPMFLAVEAGVGRTMAVAMEAVTPLATAGSAQMEQVAVAAKVAAAAVGPAMAGIAAELELKRGAASDLEVGTVDTAEAGLGAEELAATAAHLNTEVGARSRIAPCYHRRQ